MGVVTSNGHEHDQEREPQQEPTVMLLGPTRSGRYHANNAVLGTSAISGRRLTSPSALCRW
jgi:hypothetical protein